jgi:hypothetical protein
MLRPAQKPQVKLQRVVGSIWACVISDTRQGVAHSALPSKDKIGQKI